MKHRDKKIALIGFDKQTATGLSRAGLEIVAHVFTGKSQKGLAAPTDPETCFDDWRAYRIGDCPAAPRETMHQIAQTAMPDFIRCTDRWDWSREFIHNWSDYNHLFALAHDYAHAWLKAHNPDVVVFSNVPHQGMAIVHFHLARALGIKTLVFIQSMFGSNSWLVEDIHDFGEFASSIPGKKVGISTAPPQKSPFYMTNVRNERVRKWRNLGHRLRARFLLAAGLTGFGEAGRRNFHRNANRWQKSVEDQNYIEAGKRLFRDRPVDEPYVYFPLHLQPEMTTDMLGGEFSDQINALERLRALVPDEIPIYIKENPKQTGRMRGDVFFKRLGKLENTRFVSRDYPGFELISNAVSVATISGTAGWEALCMGKPAIAFGNCFWNRLPGAFRFSENLAWDKISSFSFDTTRLQDAANQLSAHLHPGLCDVNYAAQVENFDKCENTGLLANALARHGLVTCQERSVSREKS